MLRRLQLFFLSLFMSGSLFAYPHPCPGQWWVEGEFLYWFPSIADTYFVLVQPTGSTFANGTRENNDFDFHPGFRVGGGYAFCGCCGWEVGIFYTRLRATEDKTVSGDALAVTTGSAETAFYINDPGGGSFSGTASSSLDLLYHRVDGFFGQRLFCCCGSRFWIQPGIEFAYVRLKEHYNYFSSVDLNGDVFQETRTWGVGPQFGIEFDYNLCEFDSCCGFLNLVFGTSGSLLVSKTEESAYDVCNTGPVLNFEDEDTWRIIPAWHARVGLNYAACFSCIGAFIEVGYEFSTYWDLIARPISPENEATAYSFLNHNNFDIQGLYIAAGITF